MKKLAFARWWRVGPGFLLGSLVTLASVAHLPLRFQRGAFDRNAAPQFVALVIVGIFSGLYLLWKRDLRISKFASLSLLALIVTSLISLLLSDSFMTSLIGDTGRYSGIASLFSLILISLVATHIRDDEWLNALLALIVGITIVTFLGALQALKIIDLPTGGGVGSTLGNLDFLSAWIGTTFLIVFVALRELRAHYLYSLGYGFLSLFVLWKIEAKQGFFDLALTAALISAYFLFRKLGIRSFTAKTWKIIASFAILLWSELIYLIPMAKIQIPGIGDDPQVSIRADFWFSAAGMFTHNLGFGVGPDNYGNYYEKYRSLHSVKATEYVLANDAHSSMMQTFATLGFFATLAYLLLILAVLYAAIDLYLRRSEKRYLLLMLAFFIFYTNALISPITLPHKAIFWLIGGLLLGANFRDKAQTEVATRSAFSWISTGIALSMLAYSLVLFLPSFATFNSAVASENSGESISYQVSNSLPCVAYAGAQLHLIEKSDGDPIAAANTILRNHPRCLDALTFVAQEALSRRDYPAARPAIYQLLDVAPARQSVVRLAAIYAMGAGDEPLKKVLTSQGLKLGILTESQLK
jgi:hypothetical protein